MLVPLFHPHSMKRLLPFVAMALLTACGSGPSQTAGQLIQQKLQEQQSATQPGQVDPQTLYWTHDTTDQLLLFDADMRTVFAMNCPAETIPSVANTQTVASCQGEDTTDEFSVFESGSGYVLRKRTVDAQDQATEWKDLQPIQKAAVQKL